MKKMLSAIKEVITECSNYGKEINTLLGYIDDIMNSGKEITNLETLCN